MERSSCSFLRCSLAAVSWRRAALPDASAIGVRQCVGGVTLSDGASVALAGQREFHDLVVADVKTAMGEEEYNKLTSEEQQQCTNVWCVTFLEWADPRPPSRSRHARRAVAPRIHYECVTRRSFFCFFNRMVGRWIVARCSGQNRLRPMSQEPPLV